MKTANKGKSGERSESVLWKERYDRQTLLIQSITSLLDKYGSSLELDNLYREFLLTLMGQFVVESSCYFEFDEASSRYELAMHYGGGNAANTPSFEASSPLILHLENVDRPCVTQDLPRTLEQAPGAEALFAMTSLIAPLKLKDRVIGVLGLGPRITRRPYREADIDIIGTLASVSAVSFSNARLFENTRASIEEINRLYDLRTEMINRITHEFRTPITVITGGLQVMKVSDETARIKESVVSAATDLEKLIESLLGLRSDARLSGSGERFNPARVVTELIPQVDEAGSKRITFEFSDRVQRALQLETIGRDPFRVVADLLLSNAVKFSDAESRVKLKLRMDGLSGTQDQDGVLVVDWQRQTQQTLDGYDLMTKQDGVEDEANTRIAGSWLVLRITDEGIGIPADELRYLGEPFRQASNSPDQRVRGKALSLAVVLKTVSEARGQLWCASEEDVGTTFTVYLPVGATL